MQEAGRRWQVYQIWLLIGPPFFFTSIQELQNEHDFQFLSFWDTFSLVTVFFLPSRQGQKVFVILRHLKLRCHCSKRFWYHDASCDTSFCGMCLTHPMANQQILIIYIPLIGPMQCSFSQKLTQNKTSIMLLKM